MNRRTLFLKVSAALSLAAAGQVLAGDGAHAARVSRSDGRSPSVAGIWHSQYVYPSTGRGKKFVGEHYVVIQQQGDRLIGESVPAVNGSVLRLDLTLSGPIATGTWVERTSPHGYYRGSVYHGAIQLVIDPMGKSMAGRWLGFDREFNVNSDAWELKWVEEASSKRAQRAYHLKAREREAGELAET